MSCNCKEKKEPTPIEQLKSDTDKALMSHARSLGDLTNKISHLMMRMDNVEKGAHIIINKYLDEMKPPFWKANL